MSKLTRRRALACALAVFFVAASGVAARAQEGDSSAARPQTPARQEVNHEVVVHLLVTAEGAESAPRVPASLDALVRQLKASLPAGDYRLAATFVNRVRDGGTYEVKGAGGLPFGSTPAQIAGAPLFFQLALSNVRLVDDAAPQPSIHILHFSLGTRVPVQTGGAAAGDKPGEALPVIQYENAGLSTQLSVREGEPTLVGTLSAGRPGQFYAVVLTARRTN